MPRKLTPEDIETIKILANSDSSEIELWLKNKDREMLFSHISLILQEYYKEHTQQIIVGWEKEFANAGLTEDDGKSAIACARRLGMNIF